MSFENRVANRVTLAYILDMAGTCGALIIASHLRLILDLGKPIGPDIFNIGVFALILPIWTVIFTLLSVHDPRRTYRFANVSEHRGRPVLYSKLLCPARSLHLMEDPWQCAKGERHVLSLCAGPR